MGFAAFGKKKTTPIAKDIEKTAFIKEKLKIEKEDAEAKGKMKARKGLRFSHPGPFFKGLKRSGRTKRFREVF